MFTTLLIANRGEIACRIIKTAKRMGISTVAIYSKADQDSLHVKLADKAYCVGEAPAAESYLNINNIITAALASHANAIHPGYGFLSENPAFARACEQAGILFVGPSVKAIEAMASKQQAKQLLEKSNVPLIPGYHGANQSDEKLLSEAKRIGFPVLLKAAMGGGGKGMRTVDNEAQFEAALLAAKREARAYFADETMLIEKLILCPRHVEIQIMADHHGQVVHIFERDCSVQRRHQKIIEEAPAPQLTSSLRQAMSQAAIAVAHEIDYRGAGTVEFLVDEQHQQFYFMEMNTRLQVEHPVTEMISGLDLVEWQLKIAANEPLPLAQKDIQCRGHAVECRIYAEDPAQGFVPSVGKIHTLIEPHFDGIRIDTAVEQGDSISRFYDPMFAKVIAWGSTRDEAIQRMQHALAHYHIGGIKTNIPFLQGIIQHPAFINTQLRTDFLTAHEIEQPKPNLAQALHCAAALDYLMSASADALKQATFGWQMHLKSFWYKQYKINETITTIKMMPEGLNHFFLTENDQTIEYRATLSNDVLYLYSHQSCFHAPVDLFEGAMTIYTTAGPVTVCSYTNEYGDASTKHTINDLSAPMPATVVAVLKKKGDDVTSGEALIVLEAMKMEHTIYAPITGQLTEIFYTPGSQVNEGALLATIKPRT